MKNGLVIECNLSNASMPNNKNVQNRLYVHMKS